MAVAEDEVFWRWGRAGVGGGGGRGCSVGNGAMLAFATWKRMVMWVYGCGGRSGGCGRGRFAGCDLHSELVKLPVG